MDRLAYPAQSPCFANAGTLRSAIANASMVRLPTHRGIAARLLFGDFSVATRCSTPRSKSRLPAPDRKRHVVAIQTHVSSLVRESSSWPSRPEKFIDLPRNPTTTNPFAVRRSTRILWHQSRLLSNTTATVRFSSRESRLFRPGAQPCQAPFCGRTPASSRRGQGRTLHSSPCHTRGTRRPTRRSPKRFQELRTSLHKMLLDGKQERARRVKATVRKCSPASAYVAFQSNCRKTAGHESESADFEYTVYCGHPPQQENHEL